MHCFEFWCLNRLHASASIVPVTDAGYLGIFVESNRNHRFAHIRSSVFPQFDDRTPNQTLIRQNTLKAKALLRTTL